MGRRYDDYEEELKVRKKKPSRSSKRGEGKTRKAPLFIRLIAWTGVLVFCFAAGYVGTSVALRMLNRQDILSRSNVAENREQAGMIMNDEQGEIRISARRVSFSIYYPKDGSIVSEKVELISGIMEEDIRQAVTRIIAKMPEKAASDVRLLTLFRAGDTLYLNFNASFLSLLSSRGEQGSALLITGLVQTMSENFSPIVQIRFLIDGKEQQGGSPVDLTSPWRLSR